MALLLLFLLLNKLVFAIGFKGLENIRIKQRVANVIEFDLHLVQIIVQSGVEYFLDRAKLQFRRETPAKFFSLVRKSSL